MNQICWVLSVCNVSNIDSEYIIMPSYLIDYSSVLSSLKTDSELVFVVEIASSILHELYFVVFSVHCFV